MKTILRAAIVAGAACNLAACATVMNGTSQPLAFKTTPSGAEIALINGMKCTTPCKYELKRGKDSMATITLAGYETAKVYIQSCTGGGTFGNILAGGIIGGVVDGSNGASNHLYPNPVYIKLAVAGSGDKALLLNKKGEVVSTLDEYNAKVEADVREGLEKQGYYPLGQSGKAN